MRHGPRKRSVIASLQREAHFSILVDSSPLPARGKAGCLSLAEHNSMITRAYELELSTGAWQGRGPARQLSRTLARFFRVSPLAADKRGGMDPPEARRGGAKTWK